MKQEPSQQANIFSHSRYAPHFMEAKRSSTRSQQLATCSVPGPFESSPIPVILLLKDPF